MILGRYATHEHYIRESPEWKRTRAAALKRAWDRCQVCNSPDRLDVHHRTYERIGAESPEDLTVLCRLCHDLFHKNGRLASSPRAAREKYLAEQKPVRDRRPRKKTPEPRMTWANTEPVLMPLVYSVRPDDERSLVTSAVARCALEGAFATECGDIKIRFSVGFFDWSGFTLLLNEWAYSSRFTSDVKSSEEERLLSYCHQLREALGNMVEQIRERKAKGTR